MKSVRRRITQLAGGLAALLLISCTITEAPMSMETSSQNAVLFEDSMAKNWQTNWFLDGENAVLEHRDGGLAFITQYKADKRVDRAAFDAQHAMLWTKQEFNGDIRITYTYTKLPECSWQKLIYIQARGIGEKPWVEDIHAWRDERTVARMDKYFKYMNLISLSLRDEIRCKRYPVVDREGSQVPCEFMPRGENKGLPEGEELAVLIEKRKESLMLRITNVKTGKIAVNHTWDLTDPTIKRNLAFVTGGRIGLRLMGGHKINFRNFKVEQL